MLSQRFEIALGHRGGRQRELGGIRADRVEAAVPGLHAGRVGVDGVQHAAGQPERLELEPQTRGAMVGAVETGRHQGGRLALDGGELRRAMLHGAVEPEPLLDDRGVEAAEHGELGGLAELRRLPVVGVAERTGGVVERDGVDPGHRCDGRPVP